MVVGILRTSVSYNLPDRQPRGYKSFNTGWFYGLALMFRNLDLTTKH